MVGALSRRAGSAPTDRGRADAPDPRRAYRPLCRRRHRSGDGRKHHRSQPMSAFTLPQVLVDALEWLQWTFFAYFIVINVTYLALNYISMFGIVRHMHEHGTRSMWNNYSAYQPP